MGWRTYLVMYFGTNDTMPSEISKKLESLGFSTSIGSVDFIYDWNGRKPAKDEILDLADKLVKMLDGSGVMFNLDTHD